MTRQQVIGTYYGVRITQVQESHTRPRYNIRLAQNQASRDQLKAYLEQTDLAGVRMEVLASLKVSCEEIGLWEMVGGYGEPQISGTGPTISPAVVTTTAPPPQLCGEAYHCPRPHTTTCTYTGGCARGRHGCTRCDEEVLRLPLLMNPGTSNEYMIYNYFGKWQLCDNPGGGGQFYINIETNESIDEVPSEMRGLMAEHWIQKQLVAQNRDRAAAERHTALPAPTTEARASHTDNDTTTNNDTTNDEFNGAAPLIPGSQTFYGSPLTFQPSLTPAEMAARLSDIDTSDWAAGVPIKNANCRCCPTISWWGKPVAANWTEWQRVVLPEWIIQYHLKCSVIRGIVDHCDRIRYFSPVTLMWQDPLTTDVKMKANRLTIHDYELIPQNHMQHIRLARVLAVLMCPICHGLQTT